MTKPKGQCKFEGCDNDIEHEELECCRTCYSGLRYWRDRPIAHKRARAQQILRLQSRMDYMVTGGQRPKKATNRKNVIDIKPTRRRRKA